MMSNQYELSPDTFVAGTSRTFELNAVNLANHPIDLTGADTHFSIIDYVNCGTPLVSKDAEVVTGGETYSRVVAELTASESIKLCGKYIYQFAIVDTSGATYCARGLLTVWRNIDVASIGQ